MSSTPQTYDLSLLDRSAEKWNSSPALRAVYADLFAEMRNNVAAGSILEIGSGIGVARNFFPGLVTSDVIATRFVDRAVSAYDIPRENWGNILAFDMLHHLQEPLRFLESAAHGLAPGGRIILAEPAGTRWGRLFYGWFHHEPCVPNAVRPPFRFEADANGEFANMGMAHALFGRERTKVSEALSEYRLALKSVRYRDFFAYPATGGFSRGSLLPASVLKMILAGEQLLPQFVLRGMALRMIVVLEKNQTA